MQYRFYAGSTSEPFATLPSATVTKVYASNGRHAVPSTGGAYLALAVDVPNGSRLAEISYLVFAPGNISTHALLDHYQPGTSNVLPPLVDRDITGAGFEVLTVALDAVVDYGSDAYAAYVFSVGVDQQVAGIRIGYRPPASPLTPINPSRVYDSRLAGGKLAGGEERTVSIATAIEGAAEVVPPGATAVAMTLTVTGTEGSGGVEGVAASWTSVVQTEPDTEGLGGAHHELIGIGRERVSLVASLITGGRETDRRRQHVELVTGRKLDPNLRLAQRRGAKRRRQAQPGASLNLRAEPHYDRGNLRGGARHRRTRPQDELVSPPSNRTGAGITWSVTSPHPGRPHVRPDVGLED